MQSQHIRPAAVAGMFYPGDAQQLARDVSSMLAAARPVALAPKALIVPHAGYVYSGAIAAGAYALLAPRRDTIRRVVLFGPTHRVPVRALAVPTVDAFATPLGTVPLDREAIATALRLPQVQAADAAHAQEHSLEVQLPFLQTVLGSFTLVPFAVGSVSGNDVAEVIDALWGGAETLIVISSDLSHYQPYATAQQIDSRTADDIVHLRPLTTYDQACGATPINGLIEAARRRGLQAQLLDLRNSGDTAGDKARVVGYAAIAFTEQEQAQTDDLGTTLLVRARNAIAAQLGEAAQPEPAHPQLDRPGATFVTLTQDGKLRGCIGSLEAHRALDADVRANAQAAAFRDPRFRPLTREEWPATRVEVSLIAPAEPIAFADEADALGKLRPGVDGIIFECEGRRATFLPQVWESLPEPTLFLAHLKQKAGFAPNFWAPGVRLYRYEVRKWKEQQTN